MAATNVWINKSNKSYPVKRIWNGVTTTIGTIYKNEIFGSQDPATYDHCPNLNDPGCVFTNSSGQRVAGQGYIALDDDYSYELVFTPLSDYPYSTVEINGKKFKTFKAHRQITIYTPGGSIWGSVAANSLIALATRDGISFSGDDNMDYIAVAYVRSSSGEAGRKKLCKRYSTKSRMALGKQCR